MIIKHTTAFKTTTRGFPGLYGCVRDSQTNVKNQLSDNIYDGYSKVHWHVNTVIFVWISNRTYSSPLTSALHRKMSKWQ
jgi:hypothetical protein